MDTKIYGKGSTENIYKLTKLGDIIKAFEELNIEEQRVNGELEELLESQASLEAKMQSLNSVIPNLHLVENDSKQLSGMISFTSTLADNVSSKVRQLDLTKNRVELCKQRVEDILDLKSCTDGVQTALQDEDYEKAAAHVNRFLNLDEDILRMSADANEGSTLDTSFKLLHEAQTKLKAIIHSKFDAAVMTGDAASVERFFKTFPLIGESQSGLAKFSKYLCSQLRDTTEKEIAKTVSAGPTDKVANVKFAKASTILFEDVAKLVEVHQPLVETYYGHGLMMMMIQHLQKECDRQMRNIVNQFKKVRDVDRKLQVIQQSSFPQRGGVVEKIDPIEFDVLLSEISMIGEKAELYIGFLRRRIFSDIDAAHQDEGKQKEMKAEAENFLNVCELSCYVQDLIGSYISMEEYYMKQMVAKAIGLDTVEKGSLTSSMVDDTFYVVKTCIGRAMSSLSVDGVCAMLNHACTVLEQDFREVLFARLRQGYVNGFDLVQAYNLMQSTIVGGRLQTTDVEGERLRAAFLTTLNNSELSCENLHMLKATIESKLNNLFSQSSEQAKAKLQSCVSDLGEISGKFREVTTFGMNQLVASAVRPRLKPSIDSFLSVSHDITEEEFSNYDVNDPWVQNLICQIDNLLVSFKNTLTPGNYDQLVGHLSSEITTMMEKVLMKSTFNKIGGMQFDKEIRTLVSYLTNVTTWTVRDKFARLNQIATILSLDRVTGILDYWGGNSGPLTWRLTPTEARMVLNLRYDFKSDDIKKLKL